MATVLKMLIGSWFIISSDFPMWLKGDKLSPTFNYTLTKHKGKPALMDVVKYTKHNKEKRITGYDVQTGEQRFTWRGKGWLFIAKSHWQVRLADPDGQWAVIYFSKTLFTPEGVDIIFRDARPDKDVLQQIKARMEDDSVLKKHLPKLVDLRP